MSLTKTTSGVDSSTWNEVKEASTTSIVFSLEHTAGSLANALKSFEVDLVCIIIGYVHVYKEEASLCFQPPQYIEYFCLSRALV